MILIIIYLPNTRDHPEDLTIPDAETMADCQPHSNGECLATGLPW